jgi:hypothetical protein
MPISNIYASNMWAISSGQHEVSVTLARGSRGWAFAEAALARVSGGGAAYAFISAYRYQHSSDQIFNVLDPNATQSARWIENCLSATITLRVINEYAFAVAKLSPWD